MFGMGMPEILLILAIALIVIGPKKLPDLAKSLGRAMGEFRRATDDLKNSLDGDNDLREIKETFQDVNSDIRGAMPSTPEDLFKSGSSSPEAPNAAEAGDPTADDQPTDGIKPTEGAKAADANGDSPPDGPPPPTEPPLGPTQNG